MKKNHSKFVGVISLIFGSLIFFSFAGPIIFSLAMSLLGIVLINYGLDSFNLRIKIFSDFQYYILHSLKLRHKS